MFCDTTHKLDKEGFIMHVESLYFNTQLSLFLVGLKTFIHSEIIANGENQLPAVTSRLSTNLRSWGGTDFWEDKTF